MEIVYYVQEEERIIRGMCGVCTAGREKLEAYLRDTGDLSQTREALEGVKGENYMMGTISRQLSAYREKQGWNSFISRCGVVMGLVF